MRIPIFMEKGAGYLTAKGVKFVTEHPYQLIEEEDTQELLNTGNFRLASAEEIRSYYNLDKATIDQEE